MTLAERLEAAWATLEAGRNGEILVRTLHDLGIPSNAMLGVDSNGDREVVFSVPVNEPIATPPSVRGVRVFARTLKVHTTAEKFLVVRCGHPSAHRVFARFAADVIEQVANSPRVANTVHEVLAAWRDMFRRESSESENVLRGLFGELDELRRLVDLDPSAVDAWRGPEQEPQDFVRGRYALEVKSSRSWSNAVEVHGLLQLYAKPFDLLALAVKHVVTDASGTSVSDAVRELVSRGVAADVVHAKIEMLGVAKDSFSELASPKFTVRETRYFRITTDSPVLTPDSLATRMLPSAVSKLTYALALDSAGLAPCTNDELDSLSKGLARS